MYHLIIPVIFCLILIPFTYAGDKVGEKRLVGGQCEYKKYEGGAQITSITRIVGSVADPNERDQVKFKFIPYGRVEETFAQIEGREFSLTLINSSYPGRRFLEKYGIEVGKVFDCYLKVITKGTCTPIFFEFPSIKLDDFSEN